MGVRGCRVVRARCARPATRPLAVGLLSLALVALAPASAMATAGLGVAPVMPTTVTVGTSGVSGKIVLTNTNTGGDFASTVCNAGDSGPCLGSRGIVLTPSCGAVDAEARCASFDPGVLTVATTASGAVGSACGGQSFATGSTGTPGEVRFTPDDGAHVVLSARGAICTINFTFSVAKSPTVDARTAIAGLQTLQSVEASAVSDQGAAAFQRASGDPTTVRPGAPALAATVPASPANNNNPMIVGSATPGTARVRLYLNAACSGTAVAEGSAGALASPGIAVAVADDATTAVYARGVDSTDSASDCSAGIGYVEDSTPPAAPAPGASSPASPANDNNPVIRGSAPADTTVRLYADPACTSFVAGPASASEFNSPGLTANVADNSVTTLYATATDAAGNASPCSPTATTYVEDSAAPETTITAGPSGGPFSFRFTFSSSEAGSSFECRVEFDAFATCASPFTTAALAAGAHTFEVRATDVAGNTDPTTAGLAFTLTAAGTVVPGSVVPFVGSTDTAPGTQGPAASTTSGTAASSPAQPGCLKVKGRLFVGTKGANKRNGGSGTDIMFGLGGNDTLRGGPGNDCIYGGAGADTVRGDAGADRLFGGTERDVLEGQAGNDRLSGQTGNDRLNGAKGRDQMFGAGGGDVLRDRYGRDVFSGGAGSDRIDARDITRADRRGRDSIRCGSGRDTVRADPRDKVARDCERVIRRSIGPSSPI